MGTGLGCLLVGDEKMLFDFEFFLLDSPVEKFELGKASSFVERLIQGKAEII